MGPIQVVVQDGNNLVLEVTPTPNTTVILDRGVAGTAATIAVGTTTSLAPGSPATVTNVGTSTAAVFNFGIPQSGTAAGGANTQVQFNTSGALAGSANMTFNGTTFNALIVTENSSPVVVQTDIGTAPNEIPLNQYLGNLAYQDARSIAGQVGVISGTAAAPAITPSTNTNTGIFFPATDTIAFAEGGVEAMRISSAANVGIGASSPTARLHVVGNQFRQNDATGSNGYVIDTSTTTTRLETLFGGSSFAIRTGASASDRLFIDGSGNLGIGTSSPGYDIQVGAGSGSKSQAIIGGSTGASTLRLDLSGTGTFTAGFNNSGAAVNNLPSGVAGLWMQQAYPIIFATSATERMRLDASGNLIHAAPTTPPTLATNGQMVFNLTSNTNLRVSVRGTDGVTRTANITLA